MTNPVPTARETLLFLPGAGGDRTMWAPVSEGLSHPGRRYSFGWPGLGGAPGDPTVRGLADLVARVEAQITGPSVLFAQSMGGLIALRAAMAKPEHVRA